MRYMFLISSPKDCGDPPQALMDAIGNATAEAMKRGHMVDAGGLTNSREGARIRISGRKLMVTDGPFAESKEVLGGYAIFEFATREEALESAQAFMQLHIDHWPGWEGLCEMRPMMDAPPCD